MPYDEFGKWRHPGGSCSECNSTGYIVTNEKAGVSDALSLYAWKCSCHIGEDRNLKYPFHDGVRRPPVKPLR